MCLAPQFAIYTAESTETCGGYPASRGYEQLDADTFASWDIDYIKVCGPYVCGPVYVYMAVCLCVCVCDDIGVLWFSCIPHRAC